jgi:hypothetical protein
MTARRGRRASQRRTSAPRDRPWWSRDDRAPHLRRPSQRQTLGASRPPLVGAAMIARAIFGGPRSGARSARLATASGGEPR